MATNQDGDHKGNRAPGKARRAAEGLTIVKKTVEVPLRPRPDKIVDAWVDDVPGIRSDSFVVMVVAGKGTPPEQYTIHRPIGHTDLSAGDWVATPTSDVHYLVSAADDPREAQIAAQEARVLLKFATEGDDPILIQDGLSYRYRNVQGKPDRAVTLEAAERSLKESIARLRHEHDEAQKGKTTKARFKHDLRRENFLDPEVLGAEAALKELRRARGKEIAEQVPRTYRTMGGPLHDRPQERIPWITEGATALEARRQVYLRIARALSGFKPGSGASQQELAEENELLKKKLAVLEETVRRQQAAPPIPPPPSKGGDSAKGQKGGSMVSQIVESIGMGPKKGNTPPASSNPQATPSQGSAGSESGGGVQSSSSSGSGSS